MSYWYLAINNKSEGPLMVDEVGARIRAGQATPQTLGFTQGMSDWTPLGQIPQFHSMFRTGTIPMPPMPAGPAGRMRSHEIDYEVFGDDMQFVEITLDPQEAVIAEAGGMMYMTNGIQMETQFGDGSQERAGFLDKVMSAGKRVLTGESLFMTLFTCRSSQPERVAFAAPYPGKIVPVDLVQMGGRLICQKDAFLCAAKGTSIGIAFSRKIGRGLFGGEDSSCKNWKEMAWHSCMPAGRSRAKNLLWVRPCESIPAVW